MDDKYKEKAKEFVDTDKAYIHAEFKDGNGSIAVSGDIKAITYTLFRIVDRTAELTGIPYGALIILMENYKQEKKEEDLGNAREC